MVGPAAVILGFTVTTLWYFKASAPIEMKFSVWSKKKEKKYSGLGGGTDSEECEFSVAYQDH